MPFTKDNPGKGRIPGSKNKVDKQAIIYAATLREQLAQDRFTLADKIIECWQDIKNLEQQDPETNSVGTPVWTPVDIINLKIKYMGTIAQYLYPKLGQVELKGDGRQRFIPAVLQVNITPTEKAQKLNIAAKRIQNDPAILTEAEYKSLDRIPDRP